MTNFNERTNALLYKNIYLTLYSQKGWCWLRVRGELETGTDYYILTQSSTDHSSTSFAFWLSCSTVGHWRLKPSVWSWFSLRLHPIFNSLKPSVSLYFCLTSTCFRLFTPVHLLIEGSVEGQYVTSFLSDTYRSKLAINPKRKYLSVCVDICLNPGRPDHWRTLNPL